MLILNADEVRQALPMADCIEAMKRAYIAISAGQAEAPLRSRLSIAKHDGTALFMPTHVAGDGDAALAIKVVTLFQRNPAKGLPLIHAGVLVMDPEDGRLLALLEGGSLTAIRTGAGCGAATDLLARRGAKTLAIIGAGAQARTQLTAACAVREIETVWVYSPTPSHLERFILAMAGQDGVPGDLRAAHSAAEAVADADIVSAATTSALPVFDHADLKAGAHVNGAGAYTQEMQEIPGETVAAALVTVDSRSAATAESGDIHVPLEQGMLSDEDIHEIGEVIGGSAPGRSSEDQITFFKSVGVAVQDAVAAQLALSNAKTMGLGTEVVF
jgi:ornithine cyclodeaminase